MKNRILTYLFFLLAFRFGMAQVVPWTVVPTSKIGYVRLKTPDSTAVYDFRFDTDGKPLGFDTNGDALGMFYDKSGVWECGGYLILDGINNTIVVYGNDGGDNGFQEFESYHFKYWRKSKNCVIDNPFGAMINAQYTTGGSDTIISVSAKPIVLTYPSSYYCLSNTSVLPITPTLTNSSFANINLEFNPNVGGFNFTNGQITSLATFVPGTYSIDFQAIDGKCIRNSSIQLVFDNKLLNTPTVTKKNPTCELQFGSVSMDTSMLTNGSKPFSFSLDALPANTTQGSPNGSFEQLKAGNYNLITKDNYGCSDTIAVKINPLTANCNPLILAPNSASNSELLIEWEGQTVIYNSLGENILSFTTPAVWDGRDKNGAMVKTGAYYIFTNGEKKKEITVVY